jgi:hypothetical protein
MAIVLNCLLVVQTRMDSLLRVVLSSLSHLRGLKPGIAESNGDKSFEFVREFNFLFLSGC